MCMNDFDLTNEDSNGFRSNNIYLRYVFFHVHEKNESFLFILNFGEKKLLTENIVFRFSVKSHTQLLFSAHYSHIIILFLPLIGGQRGFI